jgi:hypothetical protein
MECDGYQLFRGVVMARLTGFLRRYYAHATADSCHPQDS